MNTFEITQIPLIIRILKGGSDNLSRGNMSHFQALFKSLDCVQLITFLHKVLVGYILLPLDNANSKAVRIFFNPRSL
jgi:hypothetical protein